MIKGGKLTFSLGLVLLMGFGACQNYQKVFKTNDYTYIYETGKQAFISGKYDIASTLLAEVILYLKGTQAGEESLYLLGMSNYYAKDYVGAANVLQKFYQSYPKSIWAEEANFYTGMALYSIEPNPKLDQTDTYAAINEFNNYLLRYPSGKHTAQVQQLQLKLQDRLVEKEYLSAKLYYQLGDYRNNSSFGGNNYQACIIVAENALKKYPYTSLKENFLYLILSAKFDIAEKSVVDKKVERLRSAIDEYYNFINECPKSVHLASLKERFEKAEKQLKKIQNKTEVI